MGVLWKRLIAWLKHDIVRTIFSLAVVVVISISFVSRNISQEVNSPTHFSLIEDHELIAMAQKQLRESGFITCHPLNQNDLQITFIVDSIGGQVVSNIALVDEARDIYIAVVSKNYFTESDDRSSLSDSFIRAFENKFEIDVVAVLFNFRLVAWDSYEQKSNMNYIMDYHAQQIENLIKKLQAVDHD